MIEGIDISNWQGSIDWPRVARQDIKFAICKATEGAGYRDPSFVPNITGAHASGIVTGAYHFFKGAADPVSQALHFFRTCAGLPIMLPPFIDFETKATGITDLVKRALICAQECEKLFGVAPIIYSFPAFIAELRGSPELEALSRFRLWIAHYNEKPGHPVTTLPWHSFAFHQYTSKGGLYGISGDVDRNVFMGNEDDLAGLCAHSLPRVPVSLHIDGLFGEDEDTKPE